MKRIAFSALWASIAAQIVWIVIQRLNPHGNSNGTLYSLVVTVGFGALALTRGRFRAVATVLRIFVGVAFLGSVFDRFGFFGGAGKAGVSWGNFANFIAYTRQVNSFLPAGVIPALAVIESIIEGLLGLVMLIGVLLPATTWASAALLCLFGLAMTISLGISSQFFYAVFVIAAGTWTLATIDASWLSLDSLLSRVRRKRKVEESSTAVV
jgi:hypothetical protein